MKKPHVSPAEAPSLPVQRLPPPHGVKAAVAPSEGFLWPICDDDQADRGSHGSAPRAGVMI